MRVLGYSFEYFVLGLVLSALGAGLGGVAVVGEQITLTYWTHDFVLDVNAAKALITEFEAAHPNIKVEIVAIPFAEFANKLKIAIGAGTGPDVFTIDCTWIASFAELGAITPLDSFMTLNIYNDFIPSAQRTITWKGHVWASPLDESSTAIFYNKRLFEEAGIEPPKSVDEAWTWDEFLKVAKALTKDVDGDGQTDVWGVHLDYGVGEWVAYLQMPWIWENGGEVLGENNTKASGYLNSQETVEALQFFRELFTLHKVAPLSWIPDPLVNGVVAMEIDGPWHAQYFDTVFPDFEYGIAPLPYKVKHASNCGSWNLAISSTCENKEAAWELVKWMTTGEGAKKWYEMVRRLPAQRSVYEAYPELYEYPMNIFTTQLIKYGIPRPVTPAWAEVAHEVSSLFEIAALGELDLQKAADEAAARLDAILEQYRE